MGFFGNFLVLVVVLGGLFLFWRFILSRRDLPQDKIGVIARCGRWVRVYVVGPAFPHWTPFGLYKLVLLPASFVFECVADEGTARGGASVTAKGQITLLTPTRLDLLLLFVRVFGQDMAIAQERLGRIVASAMDTARQLVGCGNSRAFGEKVVEILSDQNSELIAAGFSDTDIRFSVLPGKSSNTGALASRQAARIVADTHVVYGSSAFTRIYNEQLPLFAAARDVHGVLNDKQHAELIALCHKLVADGRAACKPAAVAPASNSGGRKKKMSDEEWFDKEFEKELNKK